MKRIINTCWVSLILLLMLSGFSFADEFPFGVYLISGIPAQDSLYCPT